MLVVSDTSPILNLAAVGRADLLGSLYGEFSLPRRRKVHAWGQRLGQQV